MTAPAPRRVQPRIRFLVDLFAGPEVLDVERPAVDDFLVRDRRRFGSGELGGDLVADLCGGRCPPAGSTTRRRVCGGATGPLIGASRPAAAGFTSDWCSGAVHGD